MKTFTTVGALAFALAANAHMIMKTPIPAGNPDSSPLDASGANFPCKTGPGKLDTSKPNVMSIGSANTLSFTGSATHGGGSCQVSLAKGTDLSADTKWMVIHSIEGGCPAPNNGNQNLGDDPNGSGASKFQFTIPDHPDLGAGDYTLAWTWNNRIGNREFYMNCAYVQLGGAAKKRYAPSKPAISKRDSAPLPAMFVANIGNGCTVAEGIDVRYPDPGASVEIGPGANLGDPSGNCGATGSSPVVATTDSPNASNTVAPVASSSALAGNPGGQQQSSAANNGQYTQTNAFASFGGGNPAATGSPGNGALTQTAPNVFATVTTTSAPAVSATSAAAQQPSSAPVVTPIAQPEPSATSAPAAPAAPSSPETTGSSTSAQPCPLSENGYWSCAADGKSFQRCASGTWSASIQMAAGTSCTPGISANLAYNASGNVKRDLKSHIARRRHNLHGAIFS